MTTQPNGQTLINQVASFYHQYLDCSPEQLDLLALWTMHTHIIPAAPFSPALNICSRQKHSGKTLCLQLLGLLCDHPWMHTAAAPPLLLHQLTDGYEPFVGTLLLDDCDATFGKTRMNIKLQGLFTARFQQDARFTVRVKDDGEYIFDDRLVFFPAAFAGHGRLHPCLAERSIQIALDPKKAGSPCQPFRFYAAQNQSRSLQYDLSGWGNAHHEHFEKITPYKEDQFPPELSWRHRDCAEPLLHVADFIGGDWPQRARLALVNAFALAAFEDFYSSKQILSDIRDAFFEKGNPEWLSSADVLEFLHTIDNRTWAGWSKGKPMQPKALAHLLEPFGVQPRNHRTGPKTVPKGYYRADLEPVWQRHLPEPCAKPIPIPQTCGTAAPGCDEGINGKETCGTAAPGCDEGILRSPALPVAAELQNSTPGHSRLAASSQKPAAPVAADLQNSPPNNPKPTPSSQQTTPVAANLQNSIPSNPRPAASIQTFAATSSPVAANLQNPVSNNPKPNPSRQNPTVSHNPVAAKSQSSVPNRPNSRQPEAGRTPVAANLQTSTLSNPQPEPDVPMLGANWRGMAKRPPAPSPVAGNMKKEGIGQKIMRSVFQFQANRTHFE